MKIGRHLWGFVIMFFVAVLVAPLLLSQTAPIETHPSLQGEPHPKLETTLQLLAEQHKIAPNAARSLAQGQGIALDADTLAVIIEPESWEIDRVDRKAITALDGNIELTSDRLLRVRFPIDRLIDAADSVAGIGYMRLPYRPRPLAISEGVSVIGATSYHTAGYYGQGADVAVIDLGFAGLTAAQGAGELPGGTTVVYTHDYTGTGLETQYNHGTAVAEIVEDVAPQADLHLLKISDEVELASAVTYCLNNGIDIIVHSVGWYNTCFYDGTGVISDIANNARDNGIVWVNAAGNEADDGHWQGEFTDKDFDNYLDFGTGSDYIDGDGRDEGINVTLSAGDTLHALLTWNDWDYTPTKGSNQDYNLYLFDSPGPPATSSLNAQTGTQEPIEAITYLVPTSGTYELAIFQNSESAVANLELFVYVSSGASTSMQYHQPANSIITPANSSKVFTVGAIGHSVWATGPIQPHSSRGPSNASIHSASIVKPDIIGPDAVTTHTYGANAFLGTSAAAPHVAGAAALLLSELPTRTATQIEDKLEADAIDMGTAGKDNTYGSGRMHLAAASSPSTAAVFRVTSSGDVMADGTLYSDALAFGAADVAEWIRVSGLVEPGDVVVLDTTDPGAYHRSDTACSSLVAGVISTEPGVVLGQGLQAESRALLALVGIVPVKITAEGGPILPGDLLVSASTPGHAMRCPDPDECSCVLVGKALEPWTAGVGTILVLLTAH